MMPAALSSYPCPYCETNQNASSVLVSHLLDAHRWTGSSSRSGRPATSSDPVDAYYREAAKRKLLSGVAECALAGEIQSKGPRADEARKFLVESNLRLVVAIVRHMNANRSKLLDHIQDGNIGLMRAAELFDPKLGFRFSTYATWWIRQTITRGTTISAAIRLPDPVAWRLRKGRRLMTQGTSLEDAAAAVGLRPAQLADLIAQTSNRIISMDAPSSVVDGGTVGDFVPARQEPEKQLQADELAALMGHLNPKTRHVIARRFGLAGQFPASLEEIGDELGISRERVRQLETNGLEILKRWRFRKKFVSRTFRTRKEANVAELLPCVKGCGRNDLKPGPGKSAHERHCDGTPKPAEEKRERKTRRAPARPEKAKKKPTVSVELALEDLRERRANLLLQVPGLKEIDEAITALEKVTG